MKFHHFTRHGQFASVHQQQQQQAHNSHHQHLDKLPMRTHQQQLKQLQQATSQLQRQQHQSQDFSDDDDEFGDSRAFYESEHNLDQAAALHHQQGTSLAGSNGQSSLETSGFLMDKNKKLFPQKLWELIHNPSIQHCLRWSQDGQRVYLNRNEFEAYYLKTPNNQFHTQKAISFVRQMNMYGFRKVDDCYYENDNFRRDQQHLLRNMIRRHPNKGLFVGLDHHQLAAAAAAQQALQVNQQLQHFENQQQKHRAEQAMRLTSYLNNHHQFHPSLLSHAAQQLGKHSHSSQFEHMSSQLAQVAASHLNQQQQLPHNIMQNHGPFGHHHSSTFGKSSDGAASIHISSNKGIDLGTQSDKTDHLGVSQSRKSHLLSNHQATASIGSAALDQTHQLAHNQDSMHSTSSVETEPSQCSSVINSGSAGSPRPNSPSTRKQRLLADQQNCSSSGASASAVSVRAPVSEESFKFLSGSANHHQHVATDLSSQSLAARQALHQTLVRSLLQLKQQQPQDFLSSLQQQNSRTLLESLASLSSAGTGSIMDPASNSPTERTATPPSRSPSPAIGLKFNGSSRYVENNNIALDLAAKTPTNLKRSSQELEDNEDYHLDVGRTSHEISGEDTDAISAKVDSPVDVTKKVRRFLDNQMAHTELEDMLGLRIKREKTSSPCVRSESGYPLKKRAKFDDATYSEDLESMTKSLIMEMSDRRGDQLTVDAITEASCYTRCFLETLLDNASLIVKNEVESESENLTSNQDEDEAKREQDTADSANGLSETSSKSKRSAGVIDSACLSLAMKLMPSKLLAATRQQVEIKNQS